MSKKDKQAEGVESLESRIERLEKRMWEVDECGNAGVSDSAAMLTRLAVTHTKRLDRLKEELEERLDRLEQEWQRRVAAWVADEPLDKRLLALEREVRGQDFGNGSRQVGVLERLDRLEKEKEQTAMIAAAWQPGVEVLGRLGKVERRADALNECLCRHRANHAEDVASFERPKTMEQIVNEQEAAYAVTFWTDRIEVLEAKVADLMRLSCLVSKPPQCPDCEGEEENEPAEPCLTCRGSGKEPWCNECGLKATYAPRRKEGEGEKASGTKLDDLPPSCAMRKGQECNRCLACSPPPILDRNETPLEVGDEKEAGKFCPTCQAPGYKLENYPGSNEHYGQCSDPNCASHDAAQEVEK